MAATPIPENRAAFTIDEIVAATGFQPLSYTQIEDINLIINNQLINVQMGDVFVRGSAGADLIQFMRAGTPADPFRTRARINTLVTDFTLTGKTVTYAGASNDYITQANLTVPAEAYGEDTQKDHTVIWANTFGKAKIFGTSLGHHNETMNTDVWLDLVGRGLLWTVDGLTDDGTPKPGFEGTGKKPIVLGKPKPEADPLFQKKP